MTEQYAQRNINNPEGSSSIVASGPAFENVSPSEIEKLVTVDSTANALLLALPLANTVPAGARYTFVASTGGTNDVEVGVDDSNVLEVPGSTSATMTSDNASRTVVSDGDVLWYIIDALD